MREKGVMARIAGIVIVVCAFLLQCSAGKGSLKGNQTTNYYRIDMFRRDWYPSPFAGGCNEITRMERLGRAIERSKWRAGRLQGRGKSPEGGGDGEFIIEMGIGEPSPLVQHAIMDTSSHLTWFQCHPCSSTSAGALYNPANSSTYRPVMCETEEYCIPDNEFMCEEQDVICQYEHRYGHGSRTSGTGASETFSVRNGESNWKALPKLEFGCGHEQEGSFGGVDGIIGMGRGGISLTTQLAGHSIKKKFSYCLPAIDQASSTAHLFIGDAPPSHQRRKYSTTPFVGQNSTSHYYLSLQGISVKGKSIKYPASAFRKDEQGGLLIDPGTTLTYLPHPAYHALVDSLASRIDARPVKATLSGRTALCYHHLLPRAKIPSIAFHFKGNATFDVPAQNSFILVQDVQGRELLCLAFMNGGRAGSLGILGNIQQQNYDIVYDLEKNSLSFAPANCGRTH